MLVISRRETETVVLRDRETNAKLGEVYVLSVKGERARIGFNFPQDVVIDRLEVDEIKNPAEAPA